MHYSKTMRRARHLAHRRRAHEQRPPLPRAQGAVAARRPHLLHHHRAVAVGQGLRDHEHEPRPAGPRPVQATWERECPERALLARYKREELDAWYSNFSDGVCTRRRGTTAGDDADPQQHRRALDRDRRARVETKVVPALATVLSTADSYSDGSARAARSRRTCPRTRRRVRARDALRRRTRRRCARASGSPTLSTASRGGQRQLDEASTGAGARVRPAPRPALRGLPARHVHGALRRERRLVPPARPERASRSRRAAKDHCWTEGVEAYRPRDAGPFDYTYKTVYSVFDWCSWSTGGGARGDDTAGRPREHGTWGDAAVRRGLAAKETRGPAARTCASRLLPRRRRGAAVGARASAAAMTCAPRRARWRWRASRHPRRRRAGGGRALGIGEWFCAGTARARQTSSRAERLATTSGRRAYRSWRSSGRPRCRAPRRRRRRRVVVGRRARAAARRAASSARGAAADATGPRVVADADELFAAADAQRGAVRVRPGRRERAHAAAIAGGSSMCARSRRAATPSAPPDASAGHTSRPSSAKPTARPRARPRGVRAHEPPVAHVHEPREAAPRARAAATRPSPTTRTPSCARRPPRASPSARAGCQFEPATRRARRCRPRRLHRVQRPSRRCRAARPSRGRRQDTHGRGRHRAERAPVGVRVAARTAAAASQRAGARAYN